MKRPYLSLCVVLNVALIFFFSKTEATNKILSVVRYDTVPVTTCGDTARFYVTTTHVSAACTVHGIRTYYGDGSSSGTPIKNPPCQDADVVHFYEFPGMYTTKFCFDSFYSGYSFIRFDSFKRSFEILSSCNSLPIRIFSDVDGNSIFNPLSEEYIKVPVKVQVCKNGIPEDTVSCTSGLYYKATGVTGDVYSFKIIWAPANFNVTIPSGGIIYDTLKLYPNNYPVKYFGLVCSSTSAFDLTVASHVRAAVNRYITNITVDNLSCLPQTGSLTVRFSPKYNFSSAVPAPTSNSGNVVTWNIASLQILQPQKLILNLVAPSGAFLPTGDTVRTEYAITPSTGDINPVNNSIARFDTVRGSLDPNDISVQPAGNIAAGTKLQYTIRFENCGTDTAFNIHVMDTLSDYVDVKSLEIIEASHAMQLASFKKGTLNIVKFDFPNINLLDSSHHGLCNGSVIYTVNAKAGLADGTKIYNCAGIYFDANPVVLTNRVENTIGFPTGISEVNTPGSINIFPNPVKDELIIETGNSTNGNASISNLLGQVLMTQQLSNIRSSINVRSLPAGIYIVTVKGENGVKTQKFEKL